MDTPTIVPFGGLRPTPVRTHPVIEYLLDLVGSPLARVAIIPTATGDSTQAPGRRASC